MEYDIGLGQNRSGTANAFRSSLIRTERRHLGMRSARHRSTERLGSSLSDYLPHTSPVSVNPRFLNQLSVRSDRKYHQIHTEEKEQIKFLNNQFASFISKVSGCQFMFVPKSVSLLGFLPNIRHLHSYVCVYIKKYVCVYIKYLKLFLL